MRKSKKKKLFLRACWIITLAILTFVVIRNEGPGSRVELEGLYLDHNFRDVGRSLNECMANSDSSFQFRENLLYRSNKWFSGWHCDQVGSPNVIVSLNHQPDKGWEYFCTNSGAERTTAFFAKSEVELNNIESLSTWKQPEMRAAICINFSAIMQAITQDKRTLFHCEAGRDRAGSVASLAAALIYESNGHSIDDKFLAALECDYRKSSSLKEHKYGRMREFIEDILARDGNVQTFLYNQCGITLEASNAFARNMAH